MKGPLPGVRPATRVAAPSFRKNVTSTLLVVPVILKEMTAEPVFENVVPGGRNPITSSLSCAWAGAAANVARSRLRQTQEAGIRLRKAPEAVCRVAPAEKRLDGYNAWLKPHWAWMLLLALAPPMARHAWAPGDGIEAGRFRGMALAAWFRWL